MQSGHYNGPLLPPSSYLTPCRALTLIKQVVPVAVHSDWPTALEVSEGGGHFTTLFSRNTPPSFLSLHAVILPASSPGSLGPDRTEIVPSSKTRPVHWEEGGARQAGKGALTRALKRPVSACAHFLISLVLVAAEQLQSMLSSYGRHSLPPAFQPDCNSFQVCIFTTLHIYKPPLYFSDPIFFLS